MNKNAEQILAALKKLGPASPLQISEHTGQSASLCGYHLRNLAAAKTVKATGTSNSRRYALPDQDFEAGDTPPQERKPKKGKRAKPRATRARPAAAPAGEFIAAITHDARIVVIDGASVKTYSPEQSSAIADLALTHFTA